MKVGRVSVESVLQRGDQFEIPGSKGSRPAAGYDSNWLQPRTCAYVYSTAKAICGHFSAQNFKEVLPPIIAPEKTDEHALKPLLTVQNKTLAVQKIDQFQVKERGNLHPK